jgi:hypothetical protein
VRPGAFSFRKCEEEIKNRIVEIPLSYSFSVKVAS